MPINRLYQNWRNCNDMFEVVIYKKVHHLFHPITVQFVPLFSGFNSLLKFPIYLSKSATTAFICCPASSFRFLGSVSISIYMQILPFELHFYKIEILACRPWNLNISPASLFGCQYNHSGPLVLFFKHTENTDKYYPPVNRTLICFHLSTKKYHFILRTWWTFWGISRTWRNHLLEHNYCHILE